MRAFFRTGARAALAAAAACAVIGFGVSGSAQAAPVGAAAGTHIADVATSNAGVEQVHRRWYGRHWRPYGFYRPYAYYPYRRHYGYYGGGYPYYGGYGYGYRRWHRPGIYLRFGF